MCVGRVVVGNLYSIKLLGTISMFSSYSFLKFLLPLINQLSSSLIVHQVTFY